MTLYQSRAIVLHSMDLAEWDKLVTCFTRDFGKVKGVAKGAKRSLKRFGSGLELMTHINLHFFERERPGLARIESCRIIDSFPGIRQDLQKIAYGSHLLELANEMVAERDENREIYRLMIHLLRLLNRQESREELLRIFEVRFLALVGYQPSLNRCVACRRDMETEEQSWFSLTRGGVLCSACFQGSKHYPPVSRGTRKILLKAMVMDLAKVQRLYFSPQALEESGRILPRFIEYQLGRELKTLRFLERTSFRGVS